jgi:hypothetical protein
LTHLSAGKLVNYDDVQCNDILNILLTIGCKLLMSSNKKLETIQVLFLNKGVTTNTLKHRKVRKF